MTADFPNLTVVHHPLVQHKLTWLRSMPQRHSVACDTPDALPQVLALAEALLRQSGQLG